MSESEIGVPAGVEWFVPRGDAVESGLMHDLDDEETSSDGGWDDPERFVDSRTLTSDSWVWIGRTGDEFRTRDVVATTRLKYRYRTDRMKFGDFWRSDSPPLELGDSGEWWRDLTRGEVLYSPEDFIGLERIRS